jgi:formylglycine-generating enzyme required for sulfatase activity
LNLAAKKVGGKTHKVDVCHAAGNGAYVKISIARSALPAHLAHGDELPGGDVLDINCEFAPGGEMTVDLPGGATMDFVWIEPGTFLMGSASSEPGHESDESPQHIVTISHGFWLEKYEVTQGQWEAVMGTTPWVGGEYLEEGPDYPAQYISWDDAQDLIAELNATTDGSPYRLPTEAEWEYACRAGTGTRWSYGDSEGGLGAHAWYFFNTFDIGEAYAHQIGTKAPSPWGLFDTHGNVWEWVHDWYGSYSGDDQLDPVGPTTGTRRVVRGGSYYNIARATRSAERGFYPQDHRRNALGVRLLRDR